MKLASHDITIQILQFTPLLFFIPMHHWNREHIHEKGGRVVVRGSKDVNQEYVQVLQPFVMSVS